MDTQQLDVFLRVAQRLSISRAAEDLFLSASTVSKRLSALEGELGCRLFIRSTRSVRFTEAGVKFFSDVTEAKELLESSAQSLRNRSAARGDVQSLAVGYDRIFDSISMISSLIAGHVAAFAQAHPALNIDLRPFSYPTLISSLTEGSTDVILCGNDQPGILNPACRDKIRSRLLTGSRMIIVAPKAFGLAAVQGEERIKAMERIHTLFMLNDHRLTGNALSFFSQHGIFPALRVLQEHTQILYRVCNGEGVTVSTELAVPSFSKRFVDVIPIDGPEFQSSCYALWNSTSLNPWIEPLLAMFQNLGEEQF